MPRKRRRDEERPPLSFSGPPSPGDAEDDADGDPAEGLAPSALESEPEKGTGAPFGGGPRQRLTRRETPFGELVVYDTLVGMGNDGSRVYEGFFDDEPVAVKRLMLDHWCIVLKEFLDSSYRHPNIVRHCPPMSDTNFLYLPQERCACSLHDLVEALSASADSSCFLDPPSVIRFKTKIKLESLERVTTQGVNLWRADGYPSPLLLKLIRDVVSGLCHLHDLEVIHGDLKPRNVMITGNPLVAKLSDMGIKKFFPDDESCTYCGTSGWRAPELLVPGGRQTPAMDMFSLGCVLFFCFTHGGHPFGEHQVRDINIENNKMDLSLVKSIPEAYDLISHLLNPLHELRPKASEVLNHPIFWSSNRRLSLLCDLSNRADERLEVVYSALLKALERKAPEVFEGNNWIAQIDADVMTHLTKYRGYDGSLLQDLLRAVRYSFSHREDASENVLKLLGQDDEDLDTYFAERFPNLLIVSYQVVFQLCKREKTFRKYFRSDVYA